MCDQFEKEFISTQDDFENEKELIRTEFREKICSQEKQIHENTAKYDLLSQQYEEIKKTMVEKDEKYAKMKEENNKLGMDLTKAYNTNVTDGKNYEDSIYRLNQELNNKNKEIHKLEIQKNKAESLRNDTQMNNKS